MIENRDTQQSFEYEPVIDDMINTPRVPMIIPPDSRSVPNKALLTWVLGLVSGGLITHLLYAI